MKSYAPYFIFVTLLVTLTGCLHQEIVKRTVRIVHTKAPQQTSKSQHIINVLVHGTHLFPKWFLKMFMYCKRGMHEISTVPTSKVQYRMATQLSESDPYEFPFNSFYAFVWSGDLCFIGRKKAAMELYENLRTILRDYRKKHKKHPKLRIITMSHGGNVALNMANIENAQNLVHVNELILLCCPVQHETRDYVSSPMFEKVYSLYSSADYIQQLDPQGLYKDNQRKDASLFSDRCFKPHTKLKQAKIKINGFTIGHLNFGSKRFMSILPHILKELSQWPMEKKEGIEYVLSMHI
jgi:hypothetical protein